MRQRQCGCFTTGNAHAGSGITRGQQRFLTLYAVVHMYSCIDGAVRTYDLRAGKLRVDEIHGTMCPCSLSRAALANQPLPPCPVPKPLRAARFHHQREPVT